MVLCVWSTSTLGNHTVTNNFTQKYTARRVYVQTTLFPRIKGSVKNIYTIIFLNRTFLLSFHWNVCQISLQIWPWQLFFLYWAALCRVGSLCRMNWETTYRPFNRTFSYSALFLPQHCFVGSVYPACIHTGTSVFPVQCAWRERQINVLLCNLWAQGLLSLPNSKGASVRTAWYMCNSYISIKGQWLCIVVFEKSIL